MKKSGLLLVVVIAFLSLSNKGCKDAYLFNTGKYHRLTAQLSEDIYTADSIVKMLDVIECHWADSLPVYQDKYDELCAYMEKYNLKTKELITVKDCVIKDESIDLKKAAKYQWFKEEFVVFDSLLEGFTEQVKNYNRELVDCLRDQSRCKEVQKSKENQAILDAAQFYAELKNKPDSQIWADSVNIIQRIRKESSSLTGAPLTNKVYKDLFNALTRDIQFIISHRENKNLCNDGHIRWADLEKVYLTGSNTCERKHLEELSRKKWDVVVDSTWILDQVKASKKCAVKKRGCLCEEATNYDIEAVVDNGTCIGCSDRLALNYCPTAVIESSYPCKYAVCQKRCFAEFVKDIKAQFPRYREGIDILVEDESLCKTDLCGCINECSDNFNPKARIAAIPDTCKGKKCGCLDSTYVNFAHRVGSKYYDPSITAHIQDSCHNRGCLSPCALNYDKNATISDSSCICKVVGRVELEQEIVQQSLEKAGMKYSPESLELAFMEETDRKLFRSAEINFRQTGLDLVIDTKFQKMKIQSGSDFEGIPLGEYRFRSVNDLIDALMMFLMDNSSGLLEKMLEVKIVGEADANPIRSEGLTFNNAYRHINNESYRKLSPTVDADPVLLSNPGFDLSPNSHGVYLKENDRFYDNNLLAFLRAFIVKQKIMDIIPEVDNTKILIGAKVNTEKGGIYRKISVSIVLAGFYKYVGQEVGESDLELQSYIEALEFFDEKGYPTETKKYGSCPCYSTSPSPLDREETDAKE